MGGYCIPYVHGTHLAPILLFQLHRKVPRPWALDTYSIVIVAVLLSQHMYSYKKEQD